MNVAVSEFRANLSEWLRRAREGGEVVVTERGVPVARLLGIDASPMLEQLTADGVIGRPTSRDKPVAGDMTRPHPRQPVAPRVSEQRR